MYFFTIIALSILPMISHGATLNPNAGFAGFVDLIVGLIQNIIYLVIGLAFIVFMWGMLKRWVFNGGDAKSVEEGNKLVVAGIIGFVVMLSVWGIVRLLQFTFFS